MPRPNIITRAVLNILGADWTVVLRPFEETADGEASDLFGYCDDTAFEIHINSLRSSTSHADTLLHEVIHAIEKMLDLEISEETVRHVATALRVVFLANPKVAKWLTQ
jgi:hypothetical protein